MLIPIIVSLLLAISGAAASIKHPASRSAGYIVLAMSFAVGTAALGYNMGKFLAQQDKAKVVAQAHHVA